MNLHGAVRGAIGSINPFISAAVQVSIGEVTDVSFKPVPAYATPGQFTGSIAGNILTVTAVAQGKPLFGQQITDITGALLPNTQIVDYESVNSDGTGTYIVNPAQTVASETMAGSLVVNAQFQPLSYRDIQQADGLHLNGSRRKIYLYGKFDGIVRPDQKGGDLVTISSGVNRGVWLVAFVSEQWPDWCSVVVTLQNNA